MISKRLAAVGLALSLAFVCPGGAPGQQRGVNGGMGGGFGPRLGDRPDPNRLSSFGTDSMIVVETPERDGLKVYSIEEGTWSVYRAPKGTRVRPVGGIGNFVAALPEGPKITQLAVYVGSEKGWITQDLKEPVEGPVEELWGPVVSPGIAAYVAGRYVYAFGVQTSKWAVLELPEGVGGEESRPVVGQRVATITIGDRLFIFNAKFGRWDDSGGKSK
jgi:hypothetical protein